MAGHPRRVGAASPGRTRIGDGGDGEGRKLDRKHSSFFDEVMKPKQAVSLSAAERSRLNEAFMSVVPEGKSVLSSVSELKQLLEVLHQPALEDNKLERMMNEADANTDGVIDFDEMVRYLESEKREFELGAAPNRDLLDTFVAWGGNKDRTGNIDATQLFQNLRQVIKDFELDFDLAGYQETCCGDDGGDGVPIDYAQFEKVFGDLLTSRHFQQPEFQTLWDGPGTAPTRRPTDVHHFTKTL